MEILHGRFQPGTRRSCTIRPPAHRLRSSSPTRSFCSSAIYDELLDLALASIYSKMQKEPHWYDWLLGILVFELVLFFMGIMN